MACFATGEQGDGADQHQESRGDFSFHCGFHFWRCGDGQFHMAGGDGKVRLELVADSSVLESNMAKTS